ncbi:hypothetical protein D6774_02355 [Candidatus Woesearchaeota archaeon]|nr:MAG: hypothetical protein D6774_02355 [Candidatus Woesearchaeota archaeon]
MQVLFVHGGTTFKSREEFLDYLRNKPLQITPRKKWSAEYLTQALGEDFDIIRPSMPLKENAQYEDWKIWFERYLELCSDELILIGNSLGGIFLAKFLSENQLNKKIRSTYLICPPFDNDLDGEDLVGGFELGDDLSLLEEQGGKLTLLFSKDDPCVPPRHAHKYREKLPRARIIVYESKNGHFQVEEFPELVEMIREDVL